MNIEIDPLSYLSYQEVKDIVASEVRHSVRRILDDGEDRSDGVWVMCNAAVHEILEEELGPRFHDMVVEQTYDVARKLSEYTVFKEPGRHLPEGPGYASLRDACETDWFRELVTRRLAELVPELTMDDLAASISAMLYTSLSGKRREEADRGDR